LSRRGRSLPATADGLGTHRDPITSRCWLTLTTRSRYAQAFDCAGHINKLEGFLSVHGAAFYGFARNEATITLDKVPFTIPGAIDITVRIDWLCTQLRRHRHPIHRGGGGRCVLLGGLFD
jgi:hypothetical protein